MTHPRKSLLVAAALVAASACSGSYRVNAAGPSTPTTDAATTSSPASARTSTAAASAPPSVVASAAPSPTAAGSPSTGPSSTLPAGTRSPTPRPVPRRTPSPTTKPIPAGAVHDLSMTTGDKFSPKTITIALGDSVRATNVDAFGHTFTDTGVWDSGNVATGRSYSYRFTYPGTYQYVCSYHEARGMTGTIIVR